MIKNTAGQVIGAELINATTGAAFSGTVTVYVTGDGGTQALGSVAAGVCTSEGNGYFTYAPATTETNYDLIAFTFTGTGAIPATIQIYTRTAAQAAAIGSSGVTYPNIGTFGSLYMDALDIELGSNDSAVLFTTARRKHAINEGYRQFCDLTECLIRQTSVTVSSGGQEYNLLSTSILAAGDFLRMADQAPVYRKSDSNGFTQVIAGDDFPQREVQWLDAAASGWRSTTVGTPTAWYLRRDAGALYFGLDRRADVSTSESAELLIPYVPRPSSMTNSSEVPFGIGGSARVDLQPYQQALVHYAAHDLEKIRKDPEASDRQLQKFIGYVQRYVQTTRPKGPRSVRTGRSYFRQARRGETERGPLLGSFYR